MTNHGSFYDKLEHFYQVSDSMEMVPNESSAALLPNNESSAALLPPDGSEQNAERPRFVPEWLTGLNSRVSKEEIHSLFILSLFADRQTICIHEDRLLKKEKLSK